jgi:hypothetical protein
MSSHAAEDTRDLVSLHWAVHRAAEPDVVIDLDEARSDLRSASAEVGDVVTGLEQAPWQIAVGVLVLAGVLAVFLAWELLVKPWIAS